ncbi:recyclin-1 [Monosporozyma unispora]|nr:F-box protein: endocytic membrane traffic, recycling ReCYcling 1 [Kazachstania unispora]
MENLLQVKDIVTNIANCLRPEDFVQFRSINKQVYYELLNKQFEQVYYSQKLTIMGLETILETKENNLIDKNELKTLTPSNTFDELTKFELKNAKDVFKQIHKVFAVYCDKLNKNKLSNFFPSPYDSDPVVQSKILSNIRNFNKCNRVDPDYYQEVTSNYNVLKEVFINSCLNEMETNYNKEDYSTVGKFIGILLQTEEKNVAIDFFNSKIEYPKMAEPTIDEPLTEEKIVDMWIPLKEYLEKNIAIIDTLFKDEYPMALPFYENFVQQTLLEGINKLLKGSASDKEDYEEFLNFFPTVYFTCIEKCCKELPDSINGSMDLQEDKSYHQSLKELLDVYFEPNVIKYLSLSTGQFEKVLERQFKNFTIEQENKIETDLLNLTSKENPDDNKNKEEDAENKMNFLDSFTKVFRIANKQESNQARLNNDLTNLMNTNLQNIKNLISLELCYNIVQQAHDKVDIFLKFKCIPKLEPSINEKCEDIFRILIKTINEDHVKPAFEKAIHLLEEYDTTEGKDLDVENTKKSLEPLINFAELINIGDIILQMISIFYKNEIVNKKIVDIKDSNKKNIWQNQVLQTKKNFETTLDNFVADGLNIGITKLIDQIQFVFNTAQLPTDFYPPPNDPPKDMAPTKCARKVVELLSDHCFLLTGATDKGTIDVYQQEIGKRFFTVLVEHIKKQIISTTGAVQLICDINYYYDFISCKLRQKNIVPFFQGLKNICSLYLIGTKDSKELGKLISDLNKFQGIFTQEEIYEFVQRRQDWIAVKRDVEKVMYGLGVKDCTIM